MTTIDDTPATRVLYPNTFGGFGRCEICWRDKPDVADSKDPDNPRGPLLSTCGGCYQALRGFGEIEYPTGDELAETWKLLARWDINEEADDELIDRAVAALAPGLAYADRALWFGELGEALLWQQAIEQPGYELASHEPELRDIDLLRKHAESRVAEALDALMGGAQ